MNIVITGASRGLGFETAKAMVSMGNHNIVAIARDAESLDKLKNECFTINPKSIISCIPFDLSEHNHFDNLVTDIKTHIDSVDILFNNAGFLNFNPLESQSYDQILQQINVNYLSPTLLIQALLPLMGKALTTHIVNISSMGGFQGSVKFPGLSIYSSSKAAIASLSECLAEEFKDKNIKVNCIAPGAFSSEMLKTAFPGFDAPLSDSEMAQFTSWFCINGHKFFNGKILPASLSTP